MKVSHSQSFFNELQQQKNEERKTEHMQVIVRKVGNIIRSSQIIPRSLQSQIGKMVFSFTAPRIRKHVLHRGKSGISPVFCIVHWNAPDFLLLNVSQINLIYPNSKIYVLDNGSQQVNISAVENGLRLFNNVTLFAASPGFPIWTMRIGLDRLLFSHTKGLQFLLNYATEQQDEIVVFLDQDCVLSNNIDYLFSKFGRNVLLIGTRQGCTNNLIHASFMILQPNLINQLFGKFSFFHSASESYHGATEPYNGLSLKAKNKLLFLEWKTNNEIPAVSSYSFQGKTYAWHAGYSSRTIGYSAKSYLDGIPVLSLQSSRKQAFEFMKQIHEETIDKQLNVSNG